MQGRSRKNSGGYFRPRFERPQIFLRPIDNNDKFQMVLIDKPTPSLEASSFHTDLPEKYAPSAGISSSIGFRPVAASTPYKARIKSKQIEEKTEKPGPRLTVSQFVGKPSVSRQSKKINRTTRCLKDTPVNLRNFVNERCKSFETILIGEGDCINRGQPWVTKINERRWQSTQDKGVNTEACKKVRECGETLSSSFNRTNCSLKDFIFRDVKKLVPTKQVSQGALLGQPGKSLGLNDFLQRHAEFMPGNPVTCLNRVIPTEYDSFLGEECYRPAKHNAEVSQLEAPEIATIVVPRNPRNRIPNDRDKFSDTVCSKISQRSHSAPFCNETSKLQISKDSSKESKKIEKELQTLFSLVQKIQTDGNCVNCDCTMLETAREAINVGETDVEFWRNDNDLSVLIDHFQEKKV